MRVHQYIPEGKVQHNPLDHGYIKFIKR